MRLNGPVRDSQGSCEIPRGFRKLVARIQQELSPDLLRPAERRRLQPGGHPTAGHCAVAAEAFYHLAGRDAGFRPMVASYEGGTHWWLEKPGGCRVDPTAAQFDAATRTAIYAKGRPCGFPTPKQGQQAQPPSRRAQELIRRVRR